MIEIENVSYSVNGTKILHDLTLSLAPGGVTALVGPNGAGKSTLLSLMARLERPDAGHIRFDGLDVGNTPSSELARKLAILRQDTAVGARLTVRELVGFGRYPHHRGRPGAEDRDAVEDAIALFQLEPFANRPIDALSGGQRQRALVAMTFAQGTDYLMLDEPLNNLDMGHARGLMRRLRDLADRHGKTVIVVIHEINYASAHADRIIAMKNGRFAFAGPPQDALTSEVLTDIYETPIAVQDVDGVPVALHYA